MRTVGVDIDVEQLGGHDHVCWVFDDVDRFLVRASAYLAAGLDRGMRVGYVGGAGLQQMAAALDRLGGGRPGAVFTADLDGMYQDSDPDPREQVRSYVEATEQALRDGFSGLRVAAEVTALVTDPDRRSLFARYEHLIDEAMVDLPFSAMCAYDRTVLGAAVGELSCIHPVTNDDTAHFGIYAERSGVLGIRGDVDLDGQRLFGMALANLDLPTGTELQIDATALEFIDHRGLLELSRHLDKHGSRATMRCANHMTGRLVEILEIENIAVETEA